MAARTINIDMARGAEVDDEVAVEEDMPLAAPSEVDPDVVDEDLDPADRLPKQARKNVDGSVTLPLDHPRSVLSRKDGKTRENRFTELVLYRLTGADQRAIAAAPDDMITVVTLARAMRKNQAVVNALFDKLDLADIQAAGQVLNHFLVSGRTTGR